MFKVQNVKELLKWTAENMDDEDVEVDIEEELGYFFELYNENGRCEGDFFSALLETELKDYLWENEKEVEIFNGRFSVSRLLPNRVEIIDTAEEGGVTYTILKADGKYKIDYVDYDFSTITNPLEIAILNAIFENVV